MKRTFWNLFLLLAQFGFAYSANAFDAFEAGYEAYKRGDFAAAHQNWLRATPPIDPKINVNIGSLYYFGRGVVADHTVAFKWYLKAAKSGDKHAQHLVGKMYADGDGIQVDKVLADAWLNVASANGNPDSAQAIESLEKTMQDFEISQSKQIFIQCKLVSFTNCSI
jgi:TPR repeat protein